MKTHEKIKKILANARKRRLKIKAKKPDNLWWDLRDSVDILLEGVNELRTYTRIMDEENDPENRATVNALIPIIKALDKEINTLSNIGT